MSAVDTAWTIYAEEARRLRRLVNDPLASDNQRDAHRRTTQRAFRIFYQAFCRPHLALVQ